LRSTRTENPPEIDRRSTAVLFGFVWVGRILLKAAGGFSMKRVGIYLRVSTDSQTTDNQRLGDVDTYRIHKTMARE
jgi:hypothetical protein